MATERSLSSSRSKWTALAGLWLVCIVFARLCDAFISTHNSAKFIYLLIYFFHMPMAMMLAGMAFRDEIREHRYGILLPVFLLCLLTKILIYAIASLLHQKASFSLINDSGIASYMMALGFCMLITFFVQRLDPRGVMICSIVLACAAGYDKSLGDTLALSRMVVLYPFFFAGYAMDSQRLNKTLSKRALQFVAALILIIFVLSVYRYGANLYWLRPLLTGRNSFSSLSTNAEIGWLVRLIYYPIAFCLVFSFFAVMPESGLPILSGIGKRAPSVFALGYVMFYIFMDGFRLRDLITKLNNVLFYLVLLVVSILIAWICARPFLDKAVRWLITPQEWGAVKRQPRERLLSSLWTSRTKQMLVLLVVILFLTFTVVLYGPLSLFLGNAEDLWFSLQDVYHIVVPLFIVISAVLLLIGFILPEKARRVYIKLIFGIALALYVQGTFININYGVLDGTEIDWSQYTGYAVWSTAVWAVCIALPFMIDLIPTVKKHTERILMAAAAFLLVIQIPAMVLGLVNYKPKQGAEISVTTDGIYELSNKKNLILILFDTMDERYFTEFLAAHPEYAENLDGFVHYDNVLSSGARTIMAMPSMMTGVPYLRQTAYSEYIESIWSEETPFAAMNEAGYDVRCYTDSMFFGEGAVDCIQNLTSSRHVGSYTILGLKLYKLTAFRFAPHLLKQNFWMDTGEFSAALAGSTSDGDVEVYIENDAAFYRNYLENGGYTLSEDYDKALRLYLLIGAHSPYKLSADGLDNSKTTSVEVQVEGCFAMLNAILKDLQDKGIYDSSTLIITADHGAKSKAIHQMFLYKGPNASGPMTVSHAPVSMFDLYTMFYQLAGQTAPDNPYSMDFLSLSETEERERHAFVNSSNSASQPTVREYMTTASAREYDQYQLIAEYAGGINSPDTPYELGTRLSFEIEATANAYAVDGFGKNTGFSTTLRGPYAKMEIPIANRPKKGTMSVHMDFISGQLLESGVKAYANGKLVAETELTKKAKAIDFTFSVEEVFAAGDLLTLEFEFDAIDMSEKELPVLQRTGHSRAKSITISLVS